MSTPFLFCFVLFFGWNSSPSHFGRHFGNGGRRRWPLISFFFLGKKENYFLRFHSDVPQFVSQQLINYCVIFSWNYWMGKPWRPPPPKSNWFWRKKNENKLKLMNLNGWFHGNRFVFIESTIESTYALPSCVIFIVYRVLPSFTEFFFFLVRKFNKNCIQWERSFPLVDLWKLVDFFLSFFQSLPTQM